MARLLIGALFMVGVLYGSISDAKFIEKEKHYEKRSAEVTDSRPVCETEECRNLGHNMKQSMDETADPCVNFYQYACSKWGDHNPVPEGISSWNTLTMLQKFVQNKTTGILQEENQPDDILPIRLARKLYRACMNLEDMERRGLEPLVLTIARSGGMPMILEQDEYDENLLTWQKIDDYYIYLTGELSFVGIVIKPNEEGGIFMPYITLPAAPLGSAMLIADGDNAQKTTESGEVLIGPEIGEQLRDSHVATRAKRSADSPANLNTEERREKYRNFVTNVAVAISKARGFPITPEMVAEDVDELINFMIKLEKLRKMPISVVNMTLREFQDWYNSLGFTSKTAKIDWIHKLTTLFHNANAELNEDSLVRLHEMTYIKKLGELLNQTSPETIVNYVHWRINSHSLEATSHEMRHLVKLLNDPTAKIELDDGEEEGEDGDDDDIPVEFIQQLFQNRHEYCLQQMDMSATLDFEYVMRHFDLNAMQDVKTMVGEIQSEIASEVQESEWMNENTKTYVLEKLRTMSSVIGYPKWYENKTAVNSFYKGLVISQSHYENVINHAKRKNSKKLALSMKPVTATMMMQTDEQLEPTMVNAFYMSNSNTLAVTAADLQSPIYDSTRPIVHNYAMLGLIIGHEINHAFDSDNFGEDFPGMEAENILYDAYGARAGCFVQQFNEYALAMGWYNGTTAYGNQTAGENIADSMGLIAVYNAYKKKVENAPPQQTLPGFENLSDSQMFFLSYANVWCEDIQWDEVKSQAYTDVHSPSFMRVIGTLSNSETFAEAFNCPKGSPMNPEKKCNIWK